VDIFSEVSMANMNGQRLVYTVRPNTGLMCVKARPIQLDVDQLFVNSDLRRSG
jgi:hypothetical protein